jgi:plasmid stabilization system protein ParE
MKLEYHPQTVTDYREASDHYEGISSDLQRQFRTEALSALDRILANPSLYAEVQGIRRALLKRFPYSVVYRIVDANTVRVLVIRHHRRHPAFGRDRN